MASVSGPACTRDTPRCAWWTWGAAAVRPRCCTESGLPIRRVERIAPRSPNAGPGLAPIMIGALLGKRHKIPADQRVRIVDEHPDALADAATYTSAVDSPAGPQPSPSPARAAGERAM